MKTIILLASMLMFIISSAFAQDRDEEKNMKDVPTKVKAEFSKLYPSVKDVKWHMENGNYEGKFSSGGSKMSVQINDDGKLVQKEKYLKMSSLPKSAQDYISKNYSKVKIEEVSEITHTTDNVKQFQVETKDKVLLFDTKGNFVKEEKNDEDE